MTTDLLLGYTFANDQGLLDRDQQASIDAIMFGQQTAEAIRLPKVSIRLGRAIDASDGRALREPALPGSLGEVDGLIGLGALRKFKLAIDYAHNTLFLRPGRAKAGLRALK